MSADIPRCCPFCTMVKALLPCAGSGFLEIGEFDGKSYRWEGSPPGYLCEPARGGCGRWFGVRVVLEDD